MSCSLLADGYFDDDDLDSSRDEVLEFTLPSAELFHGLGLRHGVQDGHFEDGNGRLVAWDPSITQQGPRALLIDKDVVAEFAKNRGYHIVQLVYGEKRAPVVSDTQGPYLGTLFFSGVSVFNGLKWTGTIDARFEPDRY